MKRKHIHNYFLLVLLSAFFIVLWMGNLEMRGRLQRLNENTVKSDAYREQNMREDMISYLETSKKKGRDAGLFLLETDFGYEGFAHAYREEVFDRLKEKWNGQEAWTEYLAMTSAIWEDVKYFPIPVSTTDKKLGVSYENSWMTERTYGGKRGHEGTDIMTKKNVPGVYPIVSITDGVVTHKGWLEKGGYRIGITSPSGGYFYYAHMDSYANIEEGDQVKAGEILGFVGDTGYGPEGTVGQFPVHLHLGIYIYPQGEEISVNPYWVLRLLEAHKLRYDFHA